MEKIDIYNEQRKRTGYRKDSRLSLKPSEYKMNVQLWIMNEQEEVLLTKRDVSLTHPGLWDCIETVPLAGKSSLDAAIDAAKDLLGLRIKPEDVVWMKLDSELECPKFCDVFLCRKNFSLDIVQLNDKQYNDVQYVDRVQFEKLCKQQKMVPVVTQFYQLYEKNKQQGIFDRQYQVYIDRTKTYLKGNLHTHSTFSDGIYSADQLVTIYQEAGYQFLGMTDHDVWYRGKVDYPDFFILPGVEQGFHYQGTDETKGVYTHFNCYGSCQEILQRDSISYQDVKEIDSKLAEISQTNSLIQFNHPAVSKFEDQELLQMTHYQLFELYNHKDFLMETGMGACERSVRYLLDHGRKVLVTAGDDFHGPYQQEFFGNCFGGYVMVEAELQEESILKALRDGKFYASTGPEIMDYRLKGRVLSIKCDPVSHIIFYTNLRHCKNIYETDGGLVCHGEYVLTGEETYVWVKVIDEQGHAAWTQPIYFDATPYF